MTAGKFLLNKEKKYIQYSHFSSLFTRDFQYCYTRKLQTICFMEFNKKDPDYFVYQTQISVLQNGGRRGRDRVVWRGVQQCVIKFVSDLRQGGGFLRLLRFPPSIKLTATI